MKGTTGHYWARKIGIGRQILGFPQLRGIRRLSGAFYGPNVPLFSSFERFTVQNCKSERQSAFSQRFLLAVFAEEMPFVDYFAFWVDFSHCMSAALFCRRVEFKLLLVEDGQPNWLRFFSWAIWLTIFFDSAFGCQMTAGFSRCPVFWKLGCPSALKFGEA